MLNPSVCGWSRIHYLPVVVLALAAAVVAAVLALVATVTAVVLALAAAVVAVALALATKFELGFDVIGW